MTRRQATMAEVGEFGLLARLLPSLANGPGVVLGPGDDCAVLRTAEGLLLFTVDALVEGVHFRPGWLTPVQLGRKAFAVNASDVAAMGGLPRWCVVQIAAPARTPAAELAAISRGAAAAAAAANAVLVGGNISRAAELSVTLALIGAAPPHPIGRYGARPGHGLYVTGTLGEAALGRRQLEHARSATGGAVKRFRAPTPRVATGASLARRELASAMIDVSDGLLQDLGHLCSASGVGAEIEVAALPASRAVQRAGIDLALTGGEDYELLCAVPPEREELLARLAPQWDHRLTRIGVCTSRRGVRVRDARRRARGNSGGYDHFAGGRK
ncbi:MAG: thiamine-phosphate kinase [Candidatus Binatia bacterium]